jgi:hypothetical protein
MKSKAILFLFCAMIFMSTFAQQKYPIGTLFKRDSVIILKYNQNAKISDLLSQKNLIIEGEDLYVKKYVERISNLKDTVKNLLFENLLLKWDLSVNQAYLKRNLKNKSESLIIANSNLELMDKKIEFYQNEIKRIEKIEQIEKRTRTHVDPAIIGIFVAWTALAISILNQQARK